MKTGSWVSSQFAQDVAKFPLLEAEQEAHLVQQWQEDRDQRALRLLTGSHLRLVVKLATRLRGYGVPIDELIGAGNLGLVTAADKFDATQGTRFATYASWWIRSAMQEHVVRNWSLVKATTTADRRQLFFNLRRLKKERGEIGFGDLSPDAVAGIAAELGTSEADVVEMNRYLSGTDMSLNARVGEDAGDEWGDLLEDETPDQESVVMDSDELSKRRVLMHKGMDVLNARERHILTERRLQDEPATLDELSKQYGISRERVRQIEVRALEKLRKSMIDAAKSTGNPHALAA